MNEFHAPRLMKALAAELPQGFTAKYDPAPDDSVDDQIIILHNGKDTDISVQVGIDAMCTVNEWREDEQAIYHAPSRPVTAYRAIISDVLVRLPK